MTVPMPGHSASFDSPALLEQAISDFDAIV